jgi:hypothetical protein
VSGSKKATCPRVRSEQLGAGLPAGFSIRARFFLGVSQHTVRYTEMAPDRFNGGGIPTKSRSICKDDAWHSLYCFADREHAKLFQVMFGGDITHKESVTVLHKFAEAKARIQSSINASSVASNGAGRH